MSFCRPTPPTPLSYYSPHFSKLELRSSEMAARKGIINMPNAAADANLNCLCAEFLEPIRLHFGPIRVTSGYRCSTLNALIGGSKSSAHMDGCAVDFQPLRPRVTLIEVMGWVRSSPLPFDQLIHEYGSWIHLGIAPFGKIPRREALMIAHGTSYRSYDATKLVIP